MSVLDTFFILFKSNADEAIKGNKAFEKSNREVEDSLQDATDKSDKLGQSFLKLVEGAASVAGAYAGFSFLKTGVMNQIDYNNQLFITSKLLNQNAGSLKTMAQASAQAGGTREGALADMAALAQLARERNAVYDPATHMARVRELYKRQKSEMGRQNVLSNSGFTDQGLLLQATMSDEDFAKNQKMASKTTLSEAQARAAHDANAAKEGLSGAEGNFFTTLGTTLINPISTLISKITDLINKISGSEGGSLVAGAGIIAAGGLGAKVVAKRVLGSVSGALGGSVAETAAAIGAGALAAGSAVLATSVAAGYYVTKKLLEKFHGNDAPSAPLSSSIKSGSSDLKFWTDRGYSPQQAAAIMANIQAESGGDPFAVGDHGLARGLAQWHPDRRAAILKATGIDVYSASRDKQMEAIAWEMQGHRAGFDDAHFRSLTSPSEAAGYFSNRFETPADLLGQSIARGQSALSLASQYQGVSTSGTSVNIDKIEIHTQATSTDEIAQHIKTAVIGACSDIQSKADNGRAA